MGSKSADESLAPEEGSPKCHDHDKPASELFLNLMVSPTQPKSIFAGKATTFGLILNVSIKLTGALQNLASITNNFTK